MEGPRQVVADAGHRDVALLHRLEQGGLGARARPVDLVGHQELREHRPLHEAEGAAAVGILLQDLAAEDVRGHQVRRELHPARVEAEHGAQRLHELGLGEAGEADEEAVAPREDGDEGEIDDCLLPEDHPVDRLAGLTDRGEAALGGGDDAVVEAGGRARRLNHAVVRLPPAACNTGLQEQAARSSRECAAVRTGLARPGSPHGFSAIGTRPLAPASRAIRKAGTPVRARPVPPGRTKPSPRRADRDALRAARVAG